MQWECPRQTSFSTAPFTAPRCATQPAAATFDESIEELRQNRWLPHHLGCRPARRSWRKSKLAILSGMRHHHPQGQKVHLHRAGY
jgi:hypothetical protein